MCWIKLMAEFGTEKTEYCRQYYSKRGFWKYIWLWYLLQSCLLKTARHFVSFLTDATVSYSVSRQLTWKKSTYLSTWASQDIVWWCMQLRANHLFFFTKKKVTLFFTRCKKIIMQCVRMSVCDYVSVSEQWEQWESISAGMSVRNFLYVYMQVDQ